MNRGTDATPQGPVCGRIEHDLEFRPLAVAMTSCPPVLDGCETTWHPKCWEHLEAWRRQVPAGTPFYRLVLETT